MSFLISCPGCQSKLRVAETLIGKTIKCPKCARKLNLRGKAKTNGTAAAKPQAAAVHPLSAAKKSPVGLKEEAAPKLVAAPRPVAAPKPVAAFRKSAPVNLKNTEIPKRTSSPLASLPGKSTAAVAAPPRPMPASQKPAPVPPRPVLPRPQEQEDDEDEDSMLPAWISLWGTVAFGFGTVGLLTAQLVGSWLVTVALCVFGVAAVFRGLIVTSGKRKTKDRVWLTVGGVMCWGVLILSFFASGVLNTRWPTDTAVAAADPNKLEVVTREKPHDEREPLDEDGEADAEKQAIRQDDALLSVEAVKAGSLPGKSETSFLLIHIRHVNLGKVNHLELEGFSNQDHQPILKDASRIFAFVEQRPRKLARGAAEFAEPTTKTRRISAAEMWKADTLLVFELPATTGSLILELPTSAWGRKGVCRFRISRFPFEYVPPEKK